LFLRRSLKKVRAKYAHSSACPLIMLPLAPHQVIE